MLHIFAEYIHVNYIQKNSADLFEKKLWLQISWPFVSLLLYHVQALAKTLTVAQLTYLREQFTLLGPNKSGYISLQNFKTVSNLSFSFLLFHFFHLSGFFCCSLFSSPFCKQFLNLHGRLQALIKNSTEAMKDSKVLDFVNMVKSHFFLQYVFLMSVVKFKA